MSLVRTNPDQPKPLDPELSPLQEWASIKRRLASASELCLKELGYTWSSFKELEKLAIEEAKSIGSEMVKTESGDVQVVIKKQYIRPAKGLEFTETVHLHLLRKD